MKRLQIGILMVFLLSSISSSYGEEDYVAQTFKSGEESLLYRIHTPKDIDKQKDCPLLIFFHGAGERGDDNKKQLVHGTTDILKFTKANNIPAIIIAPQCPKGQQWVNTPWGNLSHTMPKEPSKAMSLAIQLIEDSVKKLPVDPKRIYVTGLSMGGFGTWDLIQRKPDYFAAAMPVCGGADVAEATKLKNLPIWCFHGGKDNVVKTSRSRDMIAALKKAGGTPKYTEYPEVGHASWKPAYLDQNALKWLFDQKRK
jgi:predicted peptidase